MLNNEGRQKDKEEKVGYAKTSELTLTRFNVAPISADYSLPISPMLPRRSGASSSVRPLKKKHFLL